MLKGKVAIVTGSTSGIGLGIAKELAKLGAHVMLNGFGDMQEIEKTRLAIEKETGIKTGYSDADLTKPDKITKLVKDTESALGPVDILVNNAGIQYVSPVEDFPQDKWDAVLATNLSAAFYTIKETIGSMKKRGYGRIINIASAHGLVGSKNKSAYVAAKHGIVGLTKVVALESATSGVTCNAVCPGWVLTPLVEKQINDNAAKQGITPEKAKEAMLEEKQPTMRFVTPEEIAGLVVFLCSDAAKSITGTTISIDGGWTAE